MKESTLVSFFPSFFKYAIQIIITLSALCANLTHIAICEKIGPAQRNDGCAISKIPIRSTFGEGSVGIFIIFGSFLLFFANSIR